MSSPFDSNATNIGIYRWPDILTMVLQHRTKLVQANLVAIFGALLAVPVPMLIPLLVDEVLLHRSGLLINSMNQLLPKDWQTATYYILTILAATLLLRLLNLLAHIWQSLAFARIAKDVTFRIRRHLLQRIAGVSMREYETLGSSTIASHLVTDIDTLDSFLGTATSKLLVAVISILGAALVMLWMHWQLAVLFFFLNPLVVYLTVRFSRRIKHLKKQENKAYQGFQENLAETLDAIMELRTNNRERHFIDRIVSKANHIRHRSIDFSWQSDAAARLSFTVFLTGFDLFRAVAMLLVLFSDLSIGEMLTFYAYLWFMLGPVQEVLGAQFAFQAANGALTRVNKLLTLELEPPHPALQDPFCGQDTLGIQIQHLNFSYNEGRSVLNDLCLEIAPGEKVALVSASGAGKTTLIHLLLGLYEPDSGAILYGGANIRDIGLDRVRTHVAVVLQHPALFNDSVRNNLSLGRHIEDEKLWQALEMAQLDGTIRALSDGLDNLIGRDGTRLSGGQQQRLAIARMILRDPRIVILDEATSALDATTEAQLHHSLEAFLRGRTVLIVAHRLSAVRQADRILVFQHGHIVENGKHQELVDANGVYARLYAEQL